MRICLFIILLCAGFLLPAEDALSVAESALRNRLDRLAEDEFKSVLAQTEDPVLQERARLGLARLWITQGKLAEADGLLKELTEAPNAALFSERNLMAADIALLKNDPETAQTHLNRLPILSGDLELQRKRLQARCYDMSGQKDKAVQVLLGDLTPAELPPVLQLDLADVWYPERNAEGAVQIWTRLGDGDFAALSTQRALLQRARHALREEDAAAARESLEALLSGQGLHAELEADVYPVYIRLLEEEGAYLEAAEVLSAFDKIVEDPVASMRLQALRAQNLILGGELEAAAGELKQGIALQGDQPPLARVQLLLARRFLETGKLESAATAYQAYRSVFTDPAGLLEAEAGLTTVLEELKEFAKAELIYDALYRRAEEDSPLKAEMLLKAADMAHAQQQYDTALNRYELFLLSFPGHAKTPQVMIQTSTVLAEKGELTRALNLLSRIRLQYPESLYSEKALMQQAVLLQQSLRPEQALGAYESYLERYPEGRYVADAITDKGITAYRLGLFDLALRQFTEVGERFPEHARVEQAKSLTGWTYYLMGKDEEARKAGRAFLSDYPDSPYANDVRFWLAEVAYNRGEFPLAAKSFLALTAGSAGEEIRAKSHYLAGRALMADKQPEEALAQFLLSRELQPDAPFAVDALFYTGDVLTELGRFDEAILVFDQLIRGYPDSYLVYAARGRLGDCQYTLGEQDRSRYLEALNSYKLVEESKDARLELRLQAMYKVGRTLNALERTEEARRQLEKTIQLYMANNGKVGGEASTWFLRAVTDVAQSYERSGETRSAIRIYEKLRDSGLPQAEESVRRIEDLRREQRILF